MPSTFHPNSSYADPRIDSIEAKLEQIRLELVASKSLSDLLVQDSTTPTVRYFVRQEVYNDTTNTSTVQILNLDGTAPSPAPVLPLHPVKSQASLTLDENLYSVATAGTGYAIGETLSNIRLFDSAGAAVASTWYNMSTNTTLSAAPVFANLQAGNRITRANVTSVAASATSATILAANPLRKQARIVNNSDRIFYGLYGPGVASPTNFTFMLAPLTASPLVPTGLASSEAIEEDCSLPIVGVWAAGATGSLIITEMT